MPLGYNEVTLDSGGPNEVTLESLPFEWPRSNWDLLELRMDKSTGWRALTAAAVAKLKVLYGGAHGKVDSGLRGRIVQYAEGTGHAAFTVVDWRGNSGSFAFVPDDGLELEELHGAPGYFTGRLRLAKVA